MQRVQFEIVVKKPQAFERKILRMPEHETCCGEGEANCQQ